MSTPLRWGRRAVALVVLASTAACGSDPSAPPDGHLSVLFIGNSLTYWNGMPTMLARLLDTEVDEPVTVESATLPNYGLEDHWIDPRTRDVLDLGGWDYVILQQGPSATEGRPSLLEYSELFAAEIRATGGEPGLYMVWPAITRSFDFDGVSESYRLAAENVDGLLFPAGEAWRETWRADSTVTLYGGDGFHPTEMGSYLAALVIFQQLTGRDPSTLARDTPQALGLFAPDPETAQILHDAASAANAAFAR